MAYTDCKLMYPEYMQAKDTCMRVIASEFVISQRTGVLQLAEGVPGCSLSFRLSTGYYFLGYS